MAYVYKHIRLDNNEIFYIGIGDTPNNGRAFQKISRNKFWKNIVAKTNYLVEILISDINWEVACREEIRLIKEIGRRDLNLGTLVNLTDGGEGLHNPSIETRLKMSNRMMGNTILVGHVHNEETKEKMRISASLKDKSTYLNPERNKKISDSKIGIPRTEETKEKLRRYYIGRSRIDVYGIEKASEITNKIITSNTGKHRSDEFKELQRIRFSGENSPFWGKHHTNEFKELQRIKFLGDENPGKNKTDETKRKISESRTGISSKFKGIARKRVACPHCGKIGGEGLMNRWHFNNCKFKNNENITK